MLAVVASLIREVAVQSFAYHAHGTNPAVIHGHDKTLNQQCMLAQACPMIVILQVMYCIVANLYARKVLCHCAKVAKNFWCCNHRLCYLQCDWWLENSLQKEINVIEARRIC